MRGVNAEHLEPASDLNTRGHYLFYGEDGNAFFINNGTNGNSFKCNQITWTIYDPTDTYIVTRAGTGGGTHSGGLTPIGSDERPEEVVEGAVYMRIYITSPGTSQGTYSGDHELVLSETHPGAMKLAEEGKRGDIFAVFIYD